MYTKTCKYAMYTNYISFSIMALNFCLKINNLKLLLAKKTITNY